MRLKRGRLRWWLTVVTIGVVGGGLVVLADLVPGQVPLSSGFTLRPAFLVVDAPPAFDSGTGGAGTPAPQPTPGFAPEPAPTPTAIPECGDTVLSATIDPARGYVDEPFTISLQAVTADTCTFRARIEVVGGAFTASPSGIVAVSATGGTPSWSTWILSAEAPGRVMASIFLLATDSDDVVATVTEHIRVTPSRRLDGGTEWLRALLDDTIVEASTVDGSALRVGHLSTLRFAVLGPEPGHLTEGLERRATVNICVEASGAGVSKDRCWDSSVDLSQHIEIEEHVDVHTERSGQVSVVADVAITGRIDGVTTDPVRASFRSASGTAHVTVVDRLLTVEQAVVRWLAAAGGIAFVAGVMSSLTKRVKDRRRRQEPRSVEVLDDAIDQTDVDHEVAAVGEDDIDPDRHTSKE